MAIRTLLWRGLDAPRLEIWQRYEPLGNRVVRYRSSGYQADITFDADGFVTLYQDYLERVG
jgi:putative glycolipid-binding protein